MNQLVMILNQSQAAEYREFWENQGWRVVIATPTTRYRPQP